MTLSVSFNATMQVAQIVLLFSVQTKITHHSYFPAL